MRYAIAGLGLLLVALAIFWPRRARQIEHFTSDDGMMEVVVTYKPENGQRIEGVTLHGQPLYRTRIKAGWRVGGYVE